VYNAPSIEHSKSFFKGANNMSVKLIVDSASDIVAAYCEQNGIGFAPLKTTLNGKEYRDGIDIVPNDFYAMLEANKEMAHTSQVNASEFGELFEKAVSEGHEVVALTISSGLSGTFQSARIAAADFPGKVFVVDSLTASAGEQVLLARAVALRDEGKSAAEIFKELEVLKKKVRLFLRVETLEYLKRGGRISKTSAVVGSILNIKPVIKMNAEGKLETVGKARGLKQSHQMMNENILATGGFDRSMPVAITYAGKVDDGAVDRYLADSAALFEGVSPSIEQLGCVIGTHTGPGALVVAYVAKE
jgi:DegV family protein with EDD domain